MLIKAIKLVAVCRADEERKDKPIVEELATVTHEVMQNLFKTLKSRQFQDKWTKFLEFTEILSDIGIDESYQANFLLNELELPEGEDVVTYLCDFMLGQKSPKAVTEADPRVEMGGSHSQPSFGQLVALASHLVRCMTTKYSSPD